MAIKTALKEYAKPLYKSLRTLMPGVFYHIQFYRASKRLGDLSGEADRLFESLINQSTSKKCLQIGVKEKYGTKFGENWVSVDKYDMRDFIDYHYDITDMKFDDNSFDVLVCLSILEHVPYPLQAIAEMQRVLKPGGTIWVQLPFHYPYHESPQDFWRASPDGLRIWLEDFEEILCGSMKWCRTALATSTFFCGTKKI